MTESERLTANCIADEIEKLKNLIEYMDRNLFVRVFFKVTTSLRCVFKESLMVRNREIDLTIESVLLERIKRVINERIIELKEQLSKI